MAYPTNLRNFRTFSWRIVQFLQTAEDPGGDSDPKFEFAGGGPGGRSAEKQLASEN